VIAVVATLLGLLLPALSGARDAARQARELAAGQQEMVAFVLYANDHREAVLPGYPAANMLEPGDVLDGNGDAVAGPQAQRYPWRLAPHLDYNFKGLYQDDDLLIEIQEDKASYQYVVSLYPSLGMNVVFVGGSANHLAFNKEAEEVFGRFWVSRLDEARRPSELITFASARAKNEGTGGPEQLNLEGFFRVEPPKFFTGSWEETYEEDTQTPGLNSGFVSLRHRGKAVVALFDGHCEALGFGELGDMRRWADQATEPDWELEPK